MECGECTECCELLEVKTTKATDGKLIELISVDSRAGELCIYCEKNKGCKVYDERPTICRTFSCAYAQQKEMMIELRPDKCGIIFEKLDEDLFLGTVRPNSKISEYGMRQIQEFNKQNINVVLAKYDTQEKIVFLSDKSTNFEVMQKFKSIKRKMYG